MSRPRGSRPRFSGKLRRPANPKATAAEHRHVLGLAGALADELDPAGTSAVLLAGSWARGDAHRASDIDLWVVGRRRPAKPGFYGHRSFERDGRLVSVRYSSPAQDRREMRDPARLDGAVPGWRVAKILRDPSGVASRLQWEARRFRWGPVRRARDAYLAEQLVGWSEEVAKLLRAMDTGEKETASVQRNLLANRMACLRAMQLELLGDTENGLWERVGRRAGPAFRAAQRAALGTDGGVWSESCEGALRLYAITARAALGVLRGEGRRIVLAACRRAGYPVG